MQSILIIGKKEKTREEAKNLIKENKISKFDVDIIETEKSVGIGEIRSLQKRIFLKPSQSEQKAVILEAFFGMTTESQNAFLKVLEEPPANTIIIILANSLDFFLPTVLSRCNLINLEKTTKLSGEEIEENFKLLSDLKNNYSKALVIAQDNSKDKEAALQFLEGMIVSVHDNINNNQDFSLEELGIVLKNLQKTYTIIKTTNVNPRFALENLFLNLFAYMF